MDIDKAEGIILERLEKQLPKTLKYHSVAHTKDVLDAAIKIGKNEGISDEEMLLLKTAALFHDAGYIEKANGHEKISCGIANEILPDCGYNKMQIELICGIIMATKLPQQPHSKLDRRVRRTVYLLSLFETMDQTKQSDSQQSCRIVLYAYNEYID